jgi:CPA1 family monovalent cation:H+ antiporter
VKPFELILLLVGLAVALGVLARRLAVPYPVLLVVAGFLLGLQDWTIDYALPPDVVFTAFLPPLLYAAAFNTNWAAFRGQFRAILLLAVGLVLFTTGLVAWAAHDLLGMGWGPAFVLGAIISPPDAVAAAAVAARVPLPRTVVTLLEGESLVNDASALVCYTVAVGATVTGHISAVEAAAQFVLMPTGGLLLGLGGGWLAVRLHRWLVRHDLADNKLHITLTLLTPFALYLPAEHLHVSGVLAAVAGGLYVGFRAEDTFPEELLVEGRAVWESMEFILNAVIFTLVGFMYSSIRHQVRADLSPGRLAGMAGTVALVIILARLVWVFPGAYVPRWLDRRLCGCAEPYPPANAVAVVGWTGMRGVVSLAAALALPETTADGRPFPDRDLIQYLTFWGVFATLVGQGLTLPYVIRWLRVKQFPHLHDKPAPGVSPAD